MEKKLVELTVKEFVELTGSDAPAPGGGSVSALSAALASALASMVAKLTIGKKKYADVEEDMKAASAKGDELVAKLLELIDKDTEAFNKVMAAFKLPKETAEQKQKRREAIEEATVGAAMVPLEVIKTCLEAADTVIEVAKKGNKNSASDAAVAALQLVAAAEGAFLNVAINARSLKDEERGKALETEAANLLESVKQKAQEALGAAKERI